MQYTIIIPVHNEAPTLEAFVADFFRRLPPTVGAALLEVILVENGSRDDSAAACQRLERQYPDKVRTIAIDQASYGEALKAGIRASRGSHLSILECDVLDSGFVARSIELFATERARFIVASKCHPLSHDERALKRRLLTRLFNLLLRAAFRYPGTDTHGLKSIETALAKQLCAQALTTGEVFQTELVLLAWRQGVDIAELPLDIRETRPTPVSIKRRVPVIWGMLGELRRSLDRFPTDHVAAVQRV